MATKTRKRITGLMNNFGGDRGTQTLDFFHAMEALYQLSYIPINIRFIILPTKTPVAKATTGV